MPIILIHTARRGAKVAHDRWCTVDAPNDGLDPAKAIPAPMEALESVLHEATELWREISRDLVSDPSAALAHAPACAMNVSDFGIMLAWSILVGRWASEPETTLIVCSDPWLYRQLANQTDVTSDHPPRLWKIRTRLFLRGFLSRTLVTARVLMDHIALVAKRDDFPAGGATLLVYGHPDSTTAGHDGYFGDLLTDHPHISRLLHVDCRRARAAKLAEDGRTFSLHSWGQWSTALQLPWMRWRPAGRLRNGRWGWLIRRAAAHEGGTGQGAILRWQICCQRRWLHAAKPEVVAWPWENHSWERQFVTTARTLGCRTIGYQHATIGRWEINYRPAPGPDAEDVTPDRIFTCGKVTAEILQRWGYPSDRIEIGGALRFKPAPAVQYDAAGPVFVALPFDKAIAGDLLAAVRQLSPHGFKVLVKDHPMTPFAFDDDDGLQRTTTPLDQQSPVSAVVYAGTSVGLEALLAGLPTIRFQPTSRIAPDILPDGIKVPTADTDTLLDALSEVPPPNAIHGEDIFAAPNGPLWQDALKPSSATAVAEV